MSTRPLDDDKLWAFLTEAIRDGDYRESFHSRSAHPERGISVEDVMRGLQRDDWTQFKSAAFR